MNRLWFYIQRFIERKKGEKILRSNRKTQLSDYSRISYGLSEVIVKTQYFMSWLFKVVQKFESNEEATEENYIENAIAIWAEVKKHVIATIKNYTFAISDLIIVASHRRINAPTNNNILFNIQALLTHLQSYDPTSNFIGDRKEFFRAIGKFRSENLRSGDESQLKYGWDHSADAAYIHYRIAKSVPNLRTYPKLILVSYFSLFQEVTGKLASFMDELEFIIESEHGMPNGFQDEDLITQRLLMKYLDSLVEIVAFAEAITDIDNKVHLKLNELERQARESKPQPIDLRDDERKETISQDPMYTFETETPGQADELAANFDVKVVGHIVSLIPGKTEEYKKAFKAYFDKEPVL